MFIGKYNKSVIVTYLGVLFDLIGFYLLMGISEPKLTGAVICLMLSGICDMFDGKVARMCKGRTDEDKDYGIQIDSLTDMVSFIAFPIVLLFGVSKSFNVALNPYLTILVLTLFVIAGISRLAFFNLNAALEDGPVKYYTGLPVTSTAIIFPTLYLLRYVLSDNVFVSVFLAAYAVVAFFMVFNFKLRKPKSTIWYITCSILAIVMTTLLIFLKVMK